MEKKADIIPILEGIVEQNTVSYRSDFQYDVQRLTAAMLEPSQEDRTFLWMSRPHGTWLFLERETFLRETPAFITWTYGDYVAEDDQIKACRVTVSPGRAGGFVLGKIQPLNYGEQVERVKRLALSVQTVALRFEDGITVTLPYEEYSDQFRALVSAHGKAEHIRYQPENEGELSALLYMERHPPKQRSRRPRKPTPR